MMNDYTEFRSNHVIEDRENMFVEYLNQMENAFMDIHTYDIANMEDVPEFNNKINASEFRTLEQS